MTIAFRHSAVITEIGVDVVLHSLLSTVAVRLEGGEWGSRFPLIMVKLRALQRMGGVLEIIALEGVGPFYYVD